MLAQSAGETQRNTEVEREIERERKRKGKRETLLVGPEGITPSLW